MARNSLIKTTRNKSLVRKGDYKTELAKYAKEDSAREPGLGGNFISIRGKNFSFQGTALPEPLKVVVINYAFENAFYDTEYDPENPAPPACFSIGMAEDTLKPHESSPKPQSATCAECPHNEWGSAEKGRGKACKNNRRLLVLNADVKDFDSDYVEKSEVAMMRIPPTSVKHFKGHLKKITDGIKLPIWATVTALTFDEEAATPVVIPQLSEELSGDRPLLEAIKEKRDNTAEQLLQPYDVSSYKEPSERIDRKKVKRIAGRSANKPVVKSRIRAAGKGTASVVGRAKF